MRVDRREFLSRGVSAGAAVAIGAAFARSAGVLGAPSPAAEPADRSIVDTHVHVWDTSKLKLPWFEGDALLNRSYLPEDYLASVDGLHVVRAVYVEVGAAPDQREIEARCVSELCRRPNVPVRAAVIAANPGTDGFRNDVNRVGEKSLVKGIRGAFKRGSSRLKQYIKDIRWLGEHNFSFDLLLDASEIAESADVVAACPETQFILNHCGNASPAWFGAAAQNNPNNARRRDTWRSGIDALAAHENVVCKISGVAENGGHREPAAEDLAPVVNYCVDRFGDERVIFASNWPVCLKALTLRRWVELLTHMTAPRGKDFQRRLFHLNALKVYELDS